MLTRNVYSEPGRFGGWPANHGIWGWGNEIVVGFQSCCFKVIDDGSHAIDKSKPRKNLQARSLDGGRSWSIEDGPSEQTLGNGHLDGKELSSFDFTAVDAAISFDSNKAEKGTLYQYVSADRCKTWRGPYLIRLFEDRTIEPRIDYIVKAEQSVVAFLTAHKDNGQEGNIFCAKYDHGTWQVVSWLDKEQEGFLIMPSTVQIGAHGFLTTARWQREGRWGISSYRSFDEGSSWTIGSPVIEDVGLSNPPSLLRLQDGRLCVTYAKRTSPYGIYARLSGDDGASWSDERVLRQDGGHWDLGYTRSYQLPNGEIVTIYYFCRDKKSERTIEATIWRA